MKIGTLAIFLLLSACASFNRSVKQNNITFEDLNRFKIGVATSFEVIQSFGTQDARIEKNGYYILTYNDAKTGYQRFSANFYSSDNVLFGLLWLPLPYEKGFSLTEAKNKFKEATFKESPGEPPHPHIIPHVFLLRDEKLGISILYDKYNVTVDGISLYDVHSRLPAQEKNAE